MSLWGLLQAGKTKGGLFLFITNRDVKHNLDNDILGFGEIAKQLYL